MSAEAQTRWIRPDSRRLLLAACLLQIGLIHGPRRRGPLFRNAWYVNGVYERGFREFGYNGIVLHIKRDQKVVFGRQAFVLGCLLGARESTDEQHLFDLGGMGTLRGYHIKEFTGNRVIMLNVDYLFRGDLLGRIPLKGAQLLNTILFVDTGWTSTVSRRKHLLEGFQDLRPEDFRSDVGLAVSLSRQLLRVNVARRLDGDKSTWTFSVRFMREL